MPHCKIEEHAIILLMGTSQYVRSQDPNTCLCILFTGDLPSIDKHSGVASYGAQGHVLPPSLD